MRSATTIINAMQRYIDGHINETVERHNFRRQIQQPGEPFDDYLISLRELAKTCKFCSESCLQKNIRDQIIEGLSDGDTIEDLLQESNLTLAATISKCQSREATKKNRSEMASQGTTEVVVALHKSRQPTTQTRQPACPGCGGAHHRGAAANAQHMIKPALFVTKLGILLEYAEVSKHVRPMHLEPYLKLLPMQSGSNHSRATTYSYIIWEEIKQSQHPQSVHISSSTGTKAVEVLPDSGADISAAGQETLGILCRVTTIPGLWMLDWTVDWTLDCKLCDKIILIVTKSQVIRSLL